MKELAKICNKATSFLDKLDAVHRKMHPADTAAYTPYDTYAAVALVNPASVQRSQKLYGSVETSGLNTRGLLIMDYLNLLGKRPNVQVVMRMVKGEVRKTIIQDLSTYSNTETSNTKKQILRSTIISRFLFQGKTSE